MEMIPPDAALLETLPGIGLAIAQLIVAYREINGPFETLEGLLTVQGIDPAKFDGIKDLVTVGVSPRLVFPVDRRAPKTRQLAR